MFANINQALKHLETCTQVYRWSVVQMQRHGVIDANHPAEWWRVTCHGLRSIPAYSCDGATLDEATLRALETAYKHMAEAVREQREKLQKQEAA